MRLAALALAVVACGGANRATTARPSPARPVTAADRILPLLPDGAQIVVELDLARLRANTVVGEVATRALAQLGADSHLPGLPVTTPGSPLASADVIVFAAYGVGTPQAATLTILATHHDVTGGTKLAPDLVALGPEDWIGQLQARATIAGLSPDGAAPHGKPLAAPDDLMKLRDHAVPPGATGAILRVTARLPFDARIELARALGLESAPAQLSLWGDVSDNDLAIMIDADAADPGDAHARDAGHRFGTVLRGALLRAADLPMIRALGLPGSLADARVIAQGTWVRTIIAVGPRHLARVVERANALLAGGPS
ncbi:MAG TPA: hypothetical protein VLX92_19865 [Kofleriaceae bacterium]|nr:hypothetical protein [Kofleriaceae bacterium]